MFCGALMTIKVLLVDDSKLVLELLNEILSKDPAINVVGMAVDPYDAREKIKQLDPDVITLDVEMPKMDGITFLKNLMRLRPMPVVMFSTLTEKGAYTTLKALEIGAFDFVAKPKSAITDKVDEFADSLIEKIKAAAKINIASLERLNKFSNSKDNDFSSEQKIDKIYNSSQSKIDIVAIGASTGGTEATKLILANLPSEMPPIVITQHMPESFTKSYSNRLDQISGLKVEECCNNAMVLKRNHVYVANGGKHLEIRFDNKVFHGHLNDHEPVNRHKPSVDVMFNSVAKLGSKVRAMGVILTGMGEDGAVGLKAMGESGAITLAQDQATSVVWGMPKVAFEIGATNTLMPLTKIAPYIVECCFGKT